MVLTARDTAAGQAAAAEIGCAFHPLDVTRNDSVTALAEWVDRTYGRCDVLVNNAGVMLDRGQSVLRLADTVLAQTLDTNLTGPLRLAQAFVPLMRRHQYGRIVNLSTTMAQFASGMGRGYGAYRISKAALNALTLILAAETKGTGILVNSMHPGWVQTEMGGHGAPLTTDQGAATALYLATLPADAPSGQFWENQQPIGW